MVTLAVAAWARWAGQPVVALLADVAILLLISHPLHEWGHFFAYRRLAGPSAAAVLVVRGFRVHIVRRALAWRSDVAGPLAPVLLAAGVLIGGGRWPLHAAAAVLVSAGHVLVLVMPTGDGAELRNALRDRFRPPRRR